MSKSYTDLNSNLGLARFYGDSIKFTDYKLLIRLEDVKRFRISPGGNVLVWIQNNPSAIRFHFSSKLLLWLDPLYFLKYGLRFIIFSISFIFSILKLGSHYFLPCILYSFLNTIFLSLFFWLIKLPFSRSFLFTSVLFAVSSLPLVLFLPFAPFLWYFFVSIYSLYLLVSIYLKKSTQLNMTFMATIWILMGTISYQWLVTALKIQYDMDLRKKTFVSRAYYQDDGIEWEDIRWKKPFFWRLEKYHFMDKFFHGRRIIFQIQPLLPVFLFHRPEENYSGWLAVLKGDQTDFFLLLSQYLENQKNLIWSKFLNKDGIRDFPIQSSKFKVFIQRYLFFDFYHSKEIILNFIVVSYEDSEEEKKSLIWCIKQSEASSIDYLADEIVKGLNPTFR